MRVRETTLYNSSKLFNKAQTFIQPVGNGVPDDQYGKQVHTVAQSLKQVNIPYGECNDGKAIGEPHRYRDSADGFGGCRKQLLRDFY